MNITLNNKGIGHIIALLVFVLFAGASGAAYTFVTNHDKSDNSGQQVPPETATTAITDYESCIKAEGSVVQQSYPEVCVSADGHRFTNDTVEKPKLAQAAFQYEKMTLSYDDTYWQKKNQYAEVNETCGEMEGLVLAHEDMTITASFGACGKGGGICFSDGTPECKQESLQLARIAVAPNTYRYVVGHRTSVDAGKTWDYTVGLSDQPACNGLCSFTARNIQEKVALMGLNTPKYKQVSTGTMSLAEYAKLPAVLAGVEVLKTIHY